MNVFLPIISLQNTFLDEIEAEFNGRFIYDHYRNIDNYEVDIVNLHWPDSVFSDNRYEYADFKEWLTEIRTKYPVVYTRHNTVSHTLHSKEALEFNDYINISCHAVHHFGYYSLEEHKQLYPDYNGRHAVTGHPLYRNLKNEISKEEARVKLGIPMDANVLLVFGVVRNDTERKLILRLFNELKIPRKYLLVPNFGYMQAPKILKGTKLANAWSKIKTAAVANNKNKQLDKIFVDHNDVQVYMNSADAVYIPRINSLNSGIVFLAYSFGKNIIAPNTGNIKENIMEHSAGYNPGNFQSIIAAAEKVLINPAPSKTEYTQYEPKYIAQQLEVLFGKLIKELQVNR